jgi:S-adenosyl methyltransferase
MTAPVLPAVLSASSAPAGGRLRLGGGGCRCRRTPPRFTYRYPALWQHPVTRTCSYIYGDLRDPETILRKAADALDFGRPAAILLFGILHFFADSEDPRAIVARLVEHLAPGSYLVISHLASDVHGEALTETFDRLNRQMSESVVLRTQAEVVQFFDGMDLVDPGVVQLPRWRPDPGQEAVPRDRPLPMWCAVGRKR